MMALSLADRQRRILARLVAKYIEQGEPVSSAWLAGHSDLGLSPATVRNILARLDELGLVSQPHTSAGRILIASGGEETIDRYLETAQLQAVTRHSITAKTRLRGELLKAWKQGYSMVDQELEEGLCSLSVPVCDAKNQVIAALNTAVNVAAVNRETLLSKYLPLLRKAAEDIRDTLAA